MAVIKDGKNYFALKIQDDNTKKAQSTMNKNYLNKKILRTDSQEEKIVPNEQDVILLEQIKEYIKDKETLSIARLQSEFCLGYPKARKIMHILIQEGLVENPEEFKYIVKK